MAISTLEWRYLHNILTRGAGAIGAILLALPITRINQTLQAHKTCISGVSAADTTCLTGTTGIGSVNYYHRGSPNWAGTHAGVVSSQEIPS